MNPSWLACRTHLRSAVSTGRSADFAFALPKTLYPEAGGEVHRVDPTRILSGVRLRTPALFLSVFMFTAFFLGASSAAIAQIQSRADSTLESIKSLFDDGSYISAELQARRELEDKVVNDSTQLQLQKYLAFALVAQGKNESAIEHFVDALRIDSALTLDPVMTSPKIMAVFETAKQAFRSELARERSVLNRPTSLQGPGKLRGPTFRTIIFPGWEQIYEGRSMKGYILLGAGAAAAVSSIAFDFLRRDARSKYLRTSTPGSAESAYKSYNAYYKSEFYSVSAFVLIYAYSELDVFLRLPPYLTVDYSPSGRGAGVGLRIAF